MVESSVDNEGMGKKNCSGEALNRRVANGGSDMAHTSFSIKIQGVRDRFASMVTMNGARGRLARLRANHATVNAYSTPPPRRLL